MAPGREACGELLRSVVLGTPRETRLGILLFIPTMARAVSSVLLGLVPPTRLLATIPLV